MPEKLNLTGKQFGRLTVLKEVGKNKHGFYLWLCRCECGREKVIVGSSLVRSERATRSCGHHSKLGRPGDKRPHIRRIKSINSEFQTPIDMIGQRYGRLTVIRYTGSAQKGRGGASWLCQCECGEYVIVSRKKLIGGKKKSCGCLEFELTGIDRRNKIQAKGIYHGTETK